jgi:hypothetical protein
MKNKYLKYTVNELLKLGSAIITNPQNQRKNRDTLYLYTPKAQKKLDAIAWAIYSKTHK